MRLIDADKLSKKMEKEKRDLHNGDQMYAMIMAQDMVVEAPTVDAVPVVRCRECRYGDGVNHPGNVLCEYDGGPLEYQDPDDFCSHGEKGEN